jgi:hypothetical protein
MENNATTEEPTLPMELAVLANSLLAVTDLLTQLLVSNATTEITSPETDVQETALSNAEMVVLRAERLVMTAQETPTYPLLILVLAVLLVNSRAVVMVSLIPSWVNNATEEFLAESTVLSRDVVMEPSTLKSVKHVTLPMHLLSAVPTVLVFLVVVTEFSMQVSNAMTLAHIANLTAQISAVTESSKLVLKHVIMVETPSMETATLDQMPAVSPAKKPDVVMELLIL